MSKINIKIDKAKLTQLVTIIKLFKSGDPIKIALALGIDPTDLIDVYNQLKE